MLNHKRLFIPGPSEVRAENLLAMAAPQIGHRAKEFDALYAELNQKLQKLLFTQQRVFIFTSSATGVMEASVRNLCAKKTLCCVNGAFSKRWYEITKLNGKPCEPLDVEWGDAITPELLENKIKTGEFDLVTLVSNETSTGVFSPVKEICEMMKKYPDVLLSVDAVSSMAGVKIEFDAWGIDVLFAGLQKCFGLPSGITVAAVSDKAMERAKKVENRGGYFDFVDMDKYHQKSETPATPSISHMYALNNQMNYIIDVEGIENRFARHKANGDYVRAWAKKHFELFPKKEEYSSDTVTCIKNTSGKLVADLNKELAKHYVTISNGYGDLKEKTFRIATMADTQRWEVMGLLKLIDEIWGLK